MDILRVHRADKDTCFRACRALRNLTYLEAGQVKAVGCGGVVALMTCLELNSQHSDVCHGCLSTLANVASLVSAHPSLMQAGANMAAEQALQRFKDENDLCQAAERLRSKLSLS